MRETKATMNWQHAAFASMLVVATSRPSFTHSFSSTSRVVGNVRTMASVVVPTSRPTNHHQGSRRSTVELRAGGGGGGGGGEGSIGDSGATAALGLAGILASATMMYSESALFRTGCGLPAGPFGLVGAAEGVSYLGVVCLVRFSLFTKIRTGTGLPPGPGGILGAAEGLSYLAVLAGIVVLVAQVTNYGYIPNAVPMEGGMCS
ncbi:hypothetical protein ACHAW5_003089 [Stephanodiscus triporus]|uniref:Uncharacterized protein n=1 Tax=Stephanodiscus triporus TaxID=2934178 RepID=A0ABD3MHW8_9STRA